MVGTLLRNCLGSAGYWFGLPLLVTVAGLLTGDFISHSSLLMLYLIAVLVCALRTDHLAVIFCAILSFAQFNYFFTTPRYSLLMTDFSEFVSALIFMLFAILAGGIAFRFKTHFGNIERQRDFLRMQVKLARSLQDIQDEEQALILLDEVADKFFSGRVRFVLQVNEDLPSGQGPRLVNWHPSGDFEPDPATEAMLGSLREQVNSAFDKLAVDKALKQAERKSDEDHLRSALLSSVSHDLKTPLVTMIGAATSLRDLDASLDAEDKRALLDSIISESQRLESYIQNLLDMTRLGHGELSLSREWVTIDEIYHVVMKRIRKIFPDCRVTLATDGEFPALHVHAALIEQALFNAIENAVKAGGTNSVIRVDVKQDRQVVEIRVSDHGPGLPETEWEKVFDQFYTFGQGDQYKKGTGLGLSICRSIFRVHRGDARIVPPPAGFGHCLLLTLPVDAEPPENPEP